MRTRIRHTAVLVLGFVLLALVMACGDSQPTRDIEATVEAMVELAKAAATIHSPTPTRKPTPEPTPDIEATVQARLAEERAIEATVEARAQALAKTMAEATAQAAPTPAVTPTPTSTPTQVPPTATPTPTPTQVAPTATPTTTPSPTPTPTATPTQVPPTATPVLPTATPVPPTATPTPVPNVMLRVVRIGGTGSFADIGGWTSAVPVKESDVLKYLEVAIWEETSSVHFYAFPNDYNSEDYEEVLLTEEQSIPYREQFLIEKYVDMPPSGTAERSNFIKLAFIDIASHLVDQYPNADHHLMFSGHGGPGGALFEGNLSKQDAYSVLESWSRLLGRPLGVIDLGGPCNKGSFADLDNFCEFTEYYIASDMPNGGYGMDDWTSEKYMETDPEAQYHDLFRSHGSLEDVLKARVDLHRKRYEYSKNNMITNQVAQANYLYSCSAFRVFQPEFKKFLAAVNVDYQIIDDAYQYMVNNNAPSDLKETFDSVFVHKADNRDFFDWFDVFNKYHQGMLMPLPTTD